MRAKAGSAVERPTPVDLPRVFAPRGGLVGRVSAYFSVERAASSAPRRLLPDGRVDLLFNLVEVPGEPDAAIIGVATAPRTVASRTPARLLGMSFETGEAARFLGGPVDAFRDRIVDLAEVLGAGVPSLVAELRELPTDEARVQRLHSFLEARAARRPPPPPFVRAGVDLLRARGGRGSMAALARDLGVSERRMQRAFREETGVSAKTLARIVRLQALLEQLGGGHFPSWTALAYEHGFSDQAHLNHEFRELTGSAPGEFLRARRPSDFYNPTLGFEVNLRASPQREGGAPCPREPMSSPARPRASVSPPRASRGGERGG